MSKKNDENELKEVAVSIRKMTDEEIEAYIQSEKASAVDDFIQIIKDSSIRGFGAVTINKLLKVAKENGFIEI